MLNNLIDNARNYAGDANHGTNVITITLSGPKRSLITVMDNGPGIAESEIDKVNQRFYRAEQVSDTVAGSGLGLAIVKQICILHQASLTIENIQPHGLKVSIRFQGNKAI